MPKFMELEKVCNKLYGKAVFEHCDFNLPSTFPSHKIVWRVFIAFDPVSFVNTVYTVPWTTCLLGSCVFAFRNILLGQWILLLSLVGCPIRPENRYKGISPITLQIELYSLVNLLLFCVKFSQSEDSIGALLSKVTPRCFIFFDNEISVSSI